MLSIVSNFLAHASSLFIADAGTAQDILLAINSYPTVISCHFVIGPGNFCDWAR